MPRYVILEHDHPVLHWDLMLEADGVLETWRLAQTPEIGSAIEATQLGEHRIAYLEYEGPVSGNRGVVKRWDAGDFTELADSTKEMRSLMLQGRRVKGNVQLSMVSNKEWRFVWLD